MEERIHHLEEVNRYTLDALEMAVSIGDFQTNINKLQDTSVLLSETISRVQRLIQFQTTAFFLVDEEVAGSGVISILAYLLACLTGDEEIFHDRQHPIGMRDPVICIVLESHRVNIIDTCFSQNCVLADRISPVVRRFQRKRS